MCGICGYFAKGQAESIESSILPRMLNSIAHRGPNDHGEHVDDHIALGHARLSIIDLAGGHQPIYNEDHSLCIVFNGEIYNYSSLREELRAKGHLFTTRSDTETILHLYEEVGEKCVERLWGMFAFAIWDIKRQKIFLARDRLGKKPLYYKDCKKYFAFSSEIKSLAAAGLLEHRYNPNAINQFIALNYVIGPETAHADVCKLMPGHSMTVDASGTTTRQYWDFNQVQQTEASWDDCYVKMISLIDDAVRVRLMSEVPLGAFLSGGVDSSLIVAVMTKLTGRPVETFTVGYEDHKDVSELEFARTVAQHLGSNHHEFILKPGNFLDIINEVVWFLDEPIGEYATIPLLLLSRLAKNYVTVMLSGEGADEIFGGYSIYRYMSLTDKYQSLPSSLRNYLLTPILEAVWGKKKEGKYIEWLKQPLEKRYRGNGSYFTDTMRQNLFSAEFSNSIAPDHLQELINSCYNRVKFKDTLSRMLYLDTMTWLPEDLLIKADKMTMAAGIELRVPFLDHRLVEFAASLPSQMKIKGSVTKYIMKKYAEKLLPREIVHRPKRGFPVPMKQWMGGEVGRAAREILLDAQTRRRGILSMPYVEELFRRHESGVEDYSKNLWTLTILEIWMRTFIDGKGYKAPA